MGSISANAVPEVLEVQLESGGRRLDKILSEVWPEFTRSRLQKLIEQGCVRVNDQVVRPSFKPVLGQTVTLELPEVTETKLVPEDLDLDIRYQDEHIAVINKPAGMVVHPSKGHDTGTLVHGLLHAMGQLPILGGEERPGIVHRLDKGTSGLMVVACNDQAHLKLQQQFADHSAGRHYMALCLGVPDLSAGCIRSQLGRDPRDRFRFSSVEEGGKLAVTHWKVEERLAPRKQGKVHTHWASLVACQLETGRTHQVRVHLMEKGFAILGDPLYKTRRQPPEWLHGLLKPIDHQLLHARRLELNHPKTGERLAFEAEPPSDFQGLIEALRAR
ncbi:MAG: RluA family pseudouridine synthase [Myxococcota bacterium]|nr:RluA family pseudouridine synthase [Myxococcota bacterium]